MNEQERATRGHNASRALTEFLDPAFDDVITAYAVRLRDLASREPWSHGKIIALANAQRIAEEVRNQIRALVSDGEHARSLIDHAQRIEKLSPAKRRLLNIGSF